MVIPSGMSSKGRCVNQIVKGAIAVGLIRFRVNVTESLLQFLLPPVPGNAIQDDGRQIVSQPLFLPTPVNLNAEFVAPVIVDRVIEMRLLPRHRQALFLPGIPNLRLFFRSSIAPAARQPATLIHRGAFERSIIPSACDSMSKFILTRMASAIRVRSDCVRPKRSASLTRNTSNFGLR